METWPDRPPSWVSTTKMPLRDVDDNIIGTFGISRNITKQKQTEEELLKAIEKAEESDHLKTSFLHNVSHEIRTPLNAIVGFSSFLGDPGLIPEKRRKYIDIIKQSSDQLLQIITDIVSIASIEAGQEKMHVTEINLNSIIKLIKDQFSIKYSNEDVALNYKTALPDDDSTITADVIKLTQILTNLVDNALKFTQQGTVNFGYKGDEDQLEFYGRTVVSAVYINQFDGVPKEVEA